MIKNYKHWLLALCFASSITQAQTVESYFQEKGLSVEQIAAKIIDRQHDPLSVYDLAVQHGISSWMLADMFAMRSTDVFKYFSTIGRDLSRLEDTTPLLSIDFENFALGEHSEAQLKAAFAAQLPSGVTIDFVNLQGRAEIIEYQGNRALKITHLTGKGSQKNGLQIYFKLGNHNELILRYQLFIDPAFDFRLAGKLPGLAGKPADASNPTGGRYTEVDGGFSARDMYLSEGRGINYLYHQNKASQNKELSAADKLKKDYYGDQISLKSGTRLFYFLTAEKLDIEHYLRMNTPGIANGELRQRVNQHTRLTYNDKILSQSGNYKINRLFLDFFHGGSGEKYNPKHDSVLYIDNLRIDRPLRKDFEIEELRY